MKSIFVPIYLSSQYQKVLDYSLYLAGKSQAELHLLLMGSSRLQKSFPPTFDLSTHEWHSPLSNLKSNTYRNIVEDIFQRCLDKGVKCKVTFLASAYAKTIIRYANAENYDLVIWGTHVTPGIKGYWEVVLASRIIGEIQAPVFVMPGSGITEELKHIIYAADMSDHDPLVVKQIKSLAGIFDAKLSVVHVNPMEPATDKDKYVLSLENMISDTMDYPKVYYRFFDHTDPFAGLKNFVQQNNAHLVAMINRRQFSWRELFYPRSITRKMAYNLSVPILAFKKNR